MRYCPSCHSVFPSEFRTCPKDQTALLTASELQPGMVLRGKYEVLGKLGAGGMATVYRARHRAFDEVRAIKLVGARLADDEDFLKRFRNEAVVARRLQHPNAVRVDDLDMTEDGRPFIVMEYVEGHNLREVIRREGALGLRRAVRVARQVASALAAAHELGIIHRDIKPDNVILAGAGESETAKVLDFGIAKIKEGALGDSGAVATRTGMVVGTPQYISPEQAMGRRGSELDGRADLYSLGVVLYEMVTGRLPFESDTAMGLILHHLQTPPPPPHELRPDLGIPEPLSAVLLRALEKDPEKRFASAGQMVAAFDELLALPLPEPEAHAFAAPVMPAVPHPHPPTPPSIPFDIDRHETRAMPRTPPVAGRAAAPMVATGTPPPLPTPSPSATLPPAGRSPAPSTPVPSPTVVAGGAGPHAGGFSATPPPLPPLLPPPIMGAPTAVFGGSMPPRGRKKRPWWLWVAAGSMIWVFFIRDDSRSRSRRPPSRVPAAAEEIDGAARAVPDERIEAAVRSALRGSPRTHRFDIEVDVDEGVVTLSGEATTGAAREAERLARAVSGVVEVANVIEQEESGHPPHADGPTIPIEPPVAPPPPALRRGLNPEKVQELLQEGREALKAGEPVRALGIFGAALGLDPWNEEAKRGMRDAGELMGAQHRERSAGRRRAMPSPAPSAP